MRLLWRLTGFVSAALWWATPALACHGTVHYIVRDEQGAILAPEKLASVQAEPRPTIEALNVESVEPFLGVTIARALRLGDCAFEGNLVLQFHGETMELQFRNLDRDNDVPYEVDSLPFQRGRFRLDFAQVYGPLVRSSEWRRMEAPSDSPVVVPEAEPAPSLIGRLEAAYVDSVRRHDLAGLDAMIADDASIIRGDRRLSKAQYLEDISRRPADGLWLEPQSLVASDGAVVASGSASRVDPSSPAARASSADRMRYTRTWGRRAGRWLLLAQHESGMAPAAATTTGARPSSVPGWPGEATDSTDGELHVRLWSISNGASVDAAVVLREVGRVITAVKEEARSQVAGGWLLTGVGTVGGQSVRWRVRFVPTPQRVVRLGWTTVAAWPSHQAAIIETLDAPAR